MTSNSMPKLQLVTTHDSKTLQRAFHRQMAKLGMARFVQETVAPLITRIGEAWSCNEHVFSQNLEKLFRTTLVDMTPRSGHSRVLLTTLSGEKRTLSLLMVEELTVMEDVYPVRLGP